MTDPQLLVLPNNLDLTAADTLRRSLIEVAAGNEILVVDASAVHRIASPCLELLVAAKVHFGMDMSFSGTSQAFLETAARLNLCKALGLQEIEYV